ncbi:serine hydrolase domain-containing protein [Noviluteimonas gilva]|uniref:Serine hydrolase n=1 Tax=Noviluteimonas gilva TaxID=2682097 RepID=A0A7C9LKD4_9GAMM|nr:serine hydrolase domain-containing protein [Lysobacter gilvus]MUV12723.1 serine hydrolase [Lysobacter gilvus]
MPGLHQRKGHKAWRAALIGLLLPIAVGSAQTPGAAPAAPVVAKPTPSAPVQVAAVGVQRTSVLNPNPLPVAQGFDVRVFEDMAQQLVADQRIPGMAMAIVQGGRIVSMRGYGITDTRAAEPIDSHTVFRLASLSKSFAGTMTGLLVNDGVIRWDSRVNEYLPDFHLQNEYATQRLTVADVLSHRVGLVHNTYDRDLEGNLDYRSLTQKLAYAPTACLPGDCYGYQNVAFSLIGDVVFAATGTFYQQEVERRILKPLGMNDASLGLEGIEASPRWAKPHVRGRGGWVSLQPKPTYYRVAPAAGVNASISDMAQWMLAHGGHRPDVLSAPLLATLHAPLVATPGEMRGSWRRQRLSSASYAIGWRVYDYAGHQVVFHAGAVQGYRGMMAMLPERDLGVVILWNSESSLPSGLLPTILDSAIGLPAQRWLDVAPFDEGLYAKQGPTEEAGVDASASTAAPR